MTDVDIDAYLERIGAERPETLDYEALARLQERHIMSVPFETIDFVERNMPSMADEAVLDKIVRQRRGGGCGELNSGFALLLKALGFRVTLHGGRVLHNGKHAFRGVHNGHLVLRVELDRPYLVDVGFRWASRRPLRFDDRGVQSDPHGDYELRYTEHGDVEMVHDGVLRWRVEMHPRDLDDFTAVMWYCSTSPDMPGADQLWASIVTPTGRVSVFNRTITEYANGERTSRVLTDDEEFLKEFEFWYGIRLGRIPDVPVTADGV